MLENTQLVVVSVNNVRQTPSLIAKERVIAQLAHLAPMLLATNKNVLYAQPELTLVMVLNVKFVNLVQLLQLLVQQAANHVHVVMNR